MSELISGKEALESILNGIDVQYLNPFNQWDDSAIAISVMDFLDCKFKFRLKPRTITINGVELAPCYAVGIDHIKNEVSIQFHNNEDAVKLNNLLLNIYGFRNA